MPLIGVSGDVGRRRLPLAQRLSKPFKREVEAGAFLIALSGAPPVAKQVNHRLGGIVNTHAHAFDHVFFNAWSQHLRAETHDLKGRGFCAGLSVFRPDRHPHARGDRIGESVKRQYRGEAHHPLRHELGGFREVVMRAKRCIGKLVESAAEPKEEAFSFILDTVAAATRL